MTGAFDRRALLGGALALTGSGLSRAQTPAPAAEAPAPNPQVVKDMARDAYTFILPLLEVCRTRDNALAAGLPANTFNHRRRLAGPADRAVTTPNNDTLYSTAFLDLRGGPVSLTVPGSPSRYFSLALMDAWSNNFHIAGTRTDGGKAGRILLATEAQAATLKPGPDIKLVTSPTTWVWALGRVLVDGEADMAAAHAVQDGITAQGAPGPKPAPRAPPRDADFKTLVPAGLALAADAGLLKTDLPFVFTLARRGMSLGVDLESAANADPALVALAQEGLDAARGGLRGVLGGSAPVDGWTYPKPNLGDFGVDYPYRAAVALGGLAALPPKEAMYMSAVGDGPGGTFDGRRAWRLDLPRLPVDAFWSLSLYEPAPQGGLYFVENPLKRYAIGDRTPGLLKEADGGVALRIGAADPGGALRANWLPAPAGPFALILRAYLPRPELLEGRFRLPPVRAA